MKRIWPLSIGCFFCIVLIMAAASSESTATNLIVTGLKFDKTRINQNESLSVTYRLKPDGKIHSCFNMGLWCHKDSLGKKLKTWGVPSSLCDDLKAGQTISQTWSLKIPDWGPGVYEIVVVADVDDYLKEENRKDNKMRKKLTVVAGQILLPDLKIQDFTLTPPRPEAERAIKVEVRVYNSGATPSGPYEVEWWANNNYKKPSCKWKVDNTVPNGGRVLECNYKGYSRPYPNVASQAVVDPQNRIKELNEKDNIRTKRVQVVPKAVSASSISGRVTGLNIPCRVYLYGPANLNLIRHSITINAPGPYTFPNLSRGRYKVRIGGEVLEDTWVNVNPAERVITCTGIAVKNVNFELKR